MKLLFSALLCLLSCCCLAQKRAAMFKLDLRGNSYHLKPSDINVHVRQVIDRSQYLDSTGSLDPEKRAAVFADKIDTNISVSNDFAFSLRNLNTGAAYSISIYYKVQLDTIRNPEFYRLRAIYQEVKVNSWTYEYHIFAMTSCRYDATLHNRTCPKCHRSDKVLPLAYEVEKEESLAGPSYPAVRYYPATDGMTDCDPNWYCERDRLKF